MAHPAQLLCGYRLVLLVEPAGPAHQPRQHRQAHLHLAGPALPQLPRGGVGTSRCSAPAAQHLANLVVELGELVPQLLGATAQCLGEPPHRRRVDAQCVLGSHSGNLTTGARPHNSPEVQRLGTDATLVTMTERASRPQVELLTRDGCTICVRVHARLVELADELGFELATTDVDAAASAGDPGLRAEFGDRLPVVLLNGREHSYWDVDEPRLRADLAH